MSPGSSTESYPAFARIGLRENPGKNLKQPHADRRPLQYHPYDHPLYTPRHYTTNHNAWKQTVGCQCYVYTLDNRQVIQCKYSELTYNPHQFVFQPPILQIKDFHSFIPVVPSFQTEKYVESGGAGLIDWSLQRTHTLLCTDVHIRTDHVRYTLRHLHYFSVVSCPHPSDSVLNIETVHSYSTNGRTDSCEGSCVHEFV
ncbi:hypothetical protein ANN_24294 [Periplaneta americana]|uniref:Uncharacterized protein n=1 Tax=Periplaneta americana TaxID=6978 RepID=A0ABQ8S2R2_PERAM|nr:hypothetical protein ANN_24294 [Periplaneta americana]